MYLEVIKLQIALCHITCTILVRPHRPSTLFAQAMWRHHHPIADVVLILVTGLPYVTKRNVLWLSPTLDLTFTHRTSSHVRFTCVRQLHVPKGGVLRPFACFHKLCFSAVPPPRNAWACCPATASTGVWYFAHKRVTSPRQRHALYVFKQVAVPAQLRWQDLKWPQCTSRLICAGLTWTSQQSAEGQGEASQPQAQV